MIILSIISAILNLINSYVVARFARKMFATTLAGSFLFSCIAIATIIEAAFDTEMLSSAIFWGIVLGFTILIMVLANPLRYFIAYGFFFILLLTLMLPLNISELIRDSSWLAIVFALVPLVPVVLFRNNIRLITIGLSSGGSFGFGLISLLSMISKTTEGMLIVYAVLYLSSIVFGIYFQFKMYDEYFGNANKLESVE
jgi:hypothetical protein